MWYSKKWSNVKSSPSWRQNNPLIIIALFYAFCVYTIALIFSLEDNFSLRIYRMPALITIASCIVFYGAGMLLYLILIKRQKQLFTILSGKIKAYCTDTDHIINVLLALLIMPVVISLYTSFKIMLPNLVPFYLDPAFMEIDRLIHFGHDPWQLTHAVFGGAEATAIIDSLYSLWFFILWGFIFFNIFLNKDLKQRMQYIICSVLVWMLLGSLSALILSSAGPVYYLKVTGTTTSFVDLIKILHSMNEELIANGNLIKIWALFIQDMLWELYMAKETEFGSGISAMPSIHVAIAAQMAFFSFQVNRWLGWVMLAYLAIILIGSVHLGWHYAIDGYVSIILTYGLWRFSGWLVKTIFQKNVGKRQNVAC
jgi:hypothetical protein